MEREQVRHVLDEHVTGSKLANGSEHLEPQNGLGVPEPLALPGRAAALARKPTGNEVNAPAVMADVSNIVNDSCSGPAAGEDAAPPLVALAEPCVVDAGEGEAEVEEADA
jgi:hypothetical protein